MSLDPGLYLVATPIGNAEDITLRALRILREADVLAAEDTRNTRKLMDIHGIPLAGRSMLPYHDHNGAAQRPKLLGAVRDGDAVAYVSDAGTPLIADPGYRLAVEAMAEGLPVTSVPGPSAVLAALTIAGLPTDRFLFAGFPPPKAVARSAFLHSLAGVPATLVFYETARRLVATLSDMAKALGPDRPAAICRELTKKFEERRPGTLTDLAAHYAAAGPPKGEIAIVVGPPLEKRVADAELDQALTDALGDHTLKDAATAVARMLGLPRRQVYARALELAGK